MQGSDLEDEVCSLVDGALTEVLFSSTSLGFAIQL